MATTSVQARKPALHLPFAVEVVIISDEMPKAKSAHAAIAGRVEGTRVYHDPKDATRRDVFVLAGCVRSVRSYHENGFDGACKFPSLFKSYRTASPAKLNRASRSAVDTEKGLVPPASIVFGNGMCI